jgi:shikimate kinase
LRGRGEAVSYGAITIMSAIATGRGATASICLTTSAEVELEPRGGPWEFFLNEERYSSDLVFRSVSYALSSLGYDIRDFSGRVHLRSDIPIGVGLKSSSSCSVAAILATLDLFGVKDYRELEVLGMSARASCEAGVSLTGAHDDAASCLLGGVNVTDNREGIIILSRKVREHDVVICIPGEKSRRPILHTKNLARYRGIADQILEMVLSGRFWEAMTLNGLLYSALMGYDPALAVAAIERGAVGSGLSGTGPAVASVFEHSSDARDFARECAERGYTVIETKLNNRRARMG